MIVAALAARNAGGPIACLAHSPAVPAMTVIAAVRRHFALIRQGLLVLAVAGSGGACSGGGGGNGGGGSVTPPPQPGTLALTIPSPALSVTTGGSGTVSLAIARGGSFSGSVTLSVGGLPAGLTSSFSPATLDATQTTSVLTVTAGTTAAAGTATLTISASGTGVTTQTATVQLVVTQPVITILATPTALGIVAGSSSTVAISIGRSAGYTGAVTLALDNPPAGITGSFSPSPTQGNASTLTLGVASTVAAAVYPVTVKATAPGAADKTLALALTVTAALPSAFSLSADPVEFELPPGRGWSTSGVLTVQRNTGFTGPVTVTVTPPSGGVVAIIGASPSTVAAGQDATNLLALAGDGTPPGVYTATVRATAPGFAEQTLQVRLRVSAPSTGNIEWKVCDGTRAMRYFAVRDGNGPWRHIIPSGPAAPTLADPSVFAFSLTQPTGAVAMITLGERTSSSPLIHGFRWEVYYMTAQEIAQRAAEECARYPEGRTRSASGTLTGYQSFDAVVASASRKALAFAAGTGPLSTTLTAQNLPGGPFDLFLTRSSFSAGGNVPIVTQQLILRRALNPAAGGALPALNFTTDGVQPVTGVVTFSNVNGETFSFVSNFLTADGLNALFHASAAYGGISRAWYGVPAAQLLPTDLHQLVATTSTVNARRAVIAYGAQVAHRTLDFGPALATPTVVGGSGATPPWVVRATGTLASDYTARAALYLRETIPDPRAMMITATRGALGAGSGYDIAVPDLSAASGFTAFWNLRRGAAVRYTVTGGDGDPGSTSETFCIQSGICDVKAVAGAVYKAAQATGTVVVP
jgi:hypothetical protein